MTTRLMQGDCLERMGEIESGSVDMILADPPYGTTACKWDSVIPFPEMWERLNKLIKPNGAIVLFGSEPFSSALRMSNIKNYKYDWVWNKKKAGNFAQSGFMPMKVNECISIFVNKGKPVYNPQKTENIKKRYDKNGAKNRIDRSNAGGLKSDVKYSDGYEKGKLLPTTIISISKDNYGKNIFHPTQKPVALMEYLIKTYTNENELVLDFTMGSGTTGVACKNLNRKFIGIELDEAYFEIAQDRISAA
jgi:site-specific DNA-methyltransferase (adenine-specific)